MKRFLLTLIVAVSVSLVASAQSVRKIEKGFVKPETEKKAVMAKQEGKAETMLTRSDAVVKDVSTADMKAALGKSVQKAEEDGVTVSALYDFPTGSYFEGPFWAEEGYYTYWLGTYAYVKARKDLTWPNYGLWNEEEDVTIDWQKQAYSNNEYVDNGEMDQDEDGNGLLSVWGYVNVPKLTITQGEQSDSYVWAYHYSSNGNDYRATLRSSTNDEDDFIFIGNFIPVKGFWTGWSSGESWKGNYKFFDEDQKAVGFAETFSANDTHVYAEAVRVFIYDENDKIVPLEGKELKATIYTFDDDNNLVEYASAIATDENLGEVQEIEGGGSTFALDFPFVEEDELVGTVESPVVLPNEDYLVAITGFENLETPISVRFSSADGFAGHGYGILEDGSFSSLFYSNVRVPSYNLAIGFSARVIDVELLEPDLEVVFPVEGGYGVTAEDVDEETGAPVYYNDVDFYSSVGNEDYYIVEAPDWVTGFEYDESYLERGYMLFYLEAEALPESVSGRSGEVVFEVFGKEIAVKVRQGDVESGIKPQSVSESRKSAVFNISGQRVGSNAKGILIQNGRKFVRK